MFVDIILGGCIMKIGRVKHFRYKTLKGVFCYMAKLLVRPKNKNSSLLNSCQYSKLGLRAVTKAQGKSLMSMANYRKDSGIVNGEHRKTKDSVE